MNYRVQIWHGSSIDSQNKFWIFFWKTKGRQKQNGRQIAKLSITHSLLELQSPDFAWKFYGQSEQILKFFWKQNGRQIAKLSITHSFLELNSPDFAWKFIWTVWTNLEFFEKQNGCQKTKWPPNRKIEHNSLITWATDSRFCMAVSMVSSKQIMRKKWSGRQKNGRRGGGVQGLQGVTQPFLELETPDFVWKFV